MVETENKIFIAHANEDKPRVRELCLQLESHGLNVWFDERSLEIGTNWQSEIRKAIKNSRFFLACFSSNSIPKKGFIQNELRLALKELESLPQDQTYFLPVLLDEIDIPEMNVGTINLSDYHFYRIYDEIEKRRLFVFLMKSIILPNTYEYQKTPSSKQHDLDYVLFLKAKNILLTRFEKFDYQHTPWNSIYADADNLRFGMQTMYGKKKRIIDIDIRIINGMIFCFSDVAAPFKEDKFEKIRDFTFKYNNQFKIGAMMLETGRYNVIRFRHSIPGSNFSDIELTGLVYDCLNAMDLVADEIWDLFKSK